MVTAAAADAMVVTCPAATQTAAVACRTSGTQTLLSSGSCPAAALAGVAGARGACLTGVGVDKIDQL